MENAFSNPNFQLFEADLLDLDALKKFRPDIATATERKSDRPSLLGNSEKAFNLGWNGSRPAYLTLSEFASDFQNTNSR